MTSDIFTGTERVEFTPEFGRAIRKGTPAELSISDCSRVINALTQKEFTLAAQYLSLIHPTLYVVTETFLEWALALPMTLERVAPDHERAICAAAFTAWCEDVLTIPELSETTAFIELKSFFKPEFLTPLRVGEYRAAQSTGQATIAADFLSATQALYTAALKAIEQADADLALSIFHDYFSDIRARHDLIALYVSAYCHSVNEQVNQTSATNTMQSALESCALLKGMWQLFSELSPAALAASLAEHLRSHFSGAGRSAAVEIIEEPDRFRLVFEPCGTGGALRQRHIQSLGILPEATPDTWHRTNEVPVYCSHCAKNEITSISLLGYPAWVTEFNPDPQQPCGWTVYKNPFEIPEIYFSRLGLKRDPAAFKQRS